MRGTERERENTTCTLDLPDIALPGRRSPALRGGSAAETARSPTLIAVRRPGDHAAAERRRDRAGLANARRGAKASAASASGASPSSRRMARALEIKASSASPDAPSSSDDVLDADALARAWREYKATGCEAARSLLIIHYMSGHVRRIAHRLSAQLPKQIDPEDLVQQVYTGLTRLIDRYSPDRDVQFETFSSRRLVGAMRDYLREQDTSGRKTRRLAKLLSRVEERFWAEHGRRPDADELCDLLDLADDEALGKFIDDARAPLTLSFASGGPEGSSAASSAGWEDADGFGGFSDDRLPPPPMRSERDDLRKWLTEGLARRDRLIVILYYYEQLTMKEIGRTLGCSESRVSQRLESIHDCLRSRLTRVGTEPLD